MMMMSRVISTEPGKAQVTIAWCLITISFTISISNKLWLGYGHIKKSLPLGTWHLQLRYFLRNSVRILVAQSDWVNKTGQWYHTRNFTHTRTITVQMARISLQIIVGAPQQWFSLRSLRGTPSSWCWYPGHCCNLSNCCLSVNCLLCNWLCSSWFVWWSNTWTKWRLSKIVVVADREIYCLYVCMSVTLLHQNYWTNLKLATKIV